MTLKDKSLALLRGTACLGVEAILDGDQVSFHLAHLKRKGDEVELVDHQSVDELEVADHKAPISLVINGRGVVSKFFSFKGNLSQASEVALQLLPNVNLDEFYVQYVSVGNDNVWGALVRKDIVQELLTKLSKQGFSIIDVYLGPIVSSLILNLTKEKSINLHGTIVTHEQGQIQEVKKGEISVDNISIGNDRISANEVIAFSGALHYLLSVESIQGNTEIAIKQRKEYDQKRIFQLGGWAALILVFVLSMTNYFMFDHYHAKYVKLDNELAESSAKLQVIDDLRNTLSVKKQLLEQTGLLAPSKTSLYADRIAETVPGAMLLGQMEIYPATAKKLKGEKQYVYENQSIKIVGYVKNSSVLNDWIKELKEYPWISEVVINSYEKVKKTTESKFELQITLIDA